MSLDLQKVTLYRLLKTQSNDLYSKLVSKYFISLNLVLFGKIQTFYKANLRIPSIEEFSACRLDEASLEYLESQILHEENDVESIEDNFLISQLRDFCVREETLSFLEKFIDGFEDLEEIEIIGQIQNHLLELNKTIPMTDELYDVGELDVIPNSDSINLYASGISNEYDAVNGGFATQELVLLGGRRGSGKSIIVANCALHRFKAGNTVAYFSIEMRYKEVYDRMLSMISEVPFLDIFKSNIGNKEKLNIFLSKADIFYKKSKIMEQLKKEIKKHYDFDKLQNDIKLLKPPLKDNRLFIIDKPDLNLSRIDHYCNLFSNRYPNFNMIVVDYINIIKEKENKDWKTQIEISDTLKDISRKYDITVLAPYQIDATGEARFAKGILDSADRSFTFFPPNIETPNQLDLYTSKIRNGKMMNFSTTINWPCLRIDESSSIPIAGRL